MHRFALERGTHLPPSKVRDILTFFRKLDIIELLSPRRKERRENHFYDFDLINHEVQIELQVVERACAKRLGDLGASARYPARNQDYQSMMV